PVFYVLADGFVGSRPVRWLGKRGTGVTQGPHHLSDHPAARGGDTGGPRAADRRCPAGWRGGPRSPESRPRSTGTTSRCAPGRAAAPSPAAPTPPRGRPGRAWAAGA